MSIRLRAFTVARGAVRQARANRFGLLARALAFSLFLAIPAVFLVLLGLLSLFGDESTVAELTTRARTVLPAEAVTLLEESLLRASEARSDGLVLAVGGFLLGLWTTVSAATTLMEGLTAAHGRRDTRGFVRRRLAALVIVGLLGAGALLVLGLLVLGPHLERWLGDATGTGTLTTWLWWTAQWPILVLALLFAFAVVLRLGPHAPGRRWRLLTPGAVTALAVWLAASAAFAVYASRFGSYEKTWGTLSAVIVTLLWLWLTSAALLLGAAVDAEAERTAVQRAPREETPRAPLRVRPEGPR